MRALPLLVLALFACQDKDSPLDSELTSGDDSADDSAAPVDADGDGFPADEDCDDDDPAVNPEAAELCDGLDNDCDGEADEDLGLTTYTDADGDGWGDEATASWACELADGQADQSGDCDDADARYHPDAEESDCADPNDYNCDGQVGYADADGDGYAACEECDDDDPAVNPGAVEVCNGQDDDCDGLSDDEDDDLDAATASTWYTDGDSDGYGDAAVLACAQPAGASEAGGDCDDADAAVHPDAVEVCNGQDDDCDGLSDDDDEDLDASTASTWYTDGDSDGYGDAAVLACAQPAGASATDGDCDDSDGATFPGAAELCDGADNDCDGYDDTMGWWSFETGSGSTAFDASAWAHDGIITGASWTGSGYQGGALDFDGSDDDVELPYSTLEPSAGFSISAWVNPDSLRSSSWDSIVSRGSTGTTTELGCCADPYFVGYYRYEMSLYTDSTATGGGMVDGGSYSGHVGSWHHVLVTADYSSGTRVIYIDGAPTATDSNAPSTPFFDGASTRFGADTNNDLPVLPFDGRIDEVKIFGCAVSASQAAADYSAGWPF